MDLSVIIITLNEEKNLSRCLASLPEGCEIIVMDSLSSDATQTIARKAGAKVYEREFDNYAEQKNAALKLANRNWVLSIDADEKLSPGLMERISRLCQTARESSNERVAAYRLRRELVFLGQKMRFGKTVDYPIRLFRKNRARFIGDIHERLEVKGAITRLRSGTITHYSYDDLSDYFEKFNDYTSRIAEKHLSEKRPMPGVSHLIRPWLEFFLRYVLRGGFLDGYAGYCYAYISSFYTFIKYAKLRERLMAKV